MADNPWVEGENPLQDPQEREETDRLWSVLEKTLAQSTIEQRRARRWGIFFKTITFAYIIGLSLFLIDQANLPWMECVQDRTLR